MDFFNENRRTFVWGLVVLAILVIDMFVLSKIIAPKIKQEVIQSLRGPYSPSPLGPGVDPDKISPAQPQSSGKPVKYKPFVVYPHEARYDYSKVNEPVSRVEAVAHRDAVASNYTEWSADWERVREAR